MIIFNNGSTKEIHPVDYPGWEKEGWTTSPQNQANQSITGLVDLNSATLDELMSLPGIKKLIANKVINARPINSLEDLTAIQGLNVEAIADKIAF